MRYKPDKPIECMTYIQYQDHLYYQSIQDRADEREYYANLEKQLEKQYEREYTAYWEKKYHDHYVLCGLKKRYKERKTK